MIRSDAEYQHTIQLLKDARLLAVDTREKLVLQGIGVDIIDMALHSSEAMQYDLQNQIRSYEIRQRLSGPYFT